MTAINTCYTKKLEWHSKTKFGYWPKSDLLKSPFHKKQCLLSLEKRELHNIIIFDTKSIPTPEKYFEYLFFHNNFDWNFI